MTLKELQEEKNALSKQVQDMAKVYNDAGQTWKDEEARSNWKKLNDDYNAKRDAVAKLVEANEIADAAKSAAEDETRSVNSGKVIPGREDTAHTKALGANEERDAEGSFDESDYSLALSGWIRGPRNATNEERAAMKKCGLSHSETEPCIQARDHASQRAERRFKPTKNGVESRAMTTVTGATGGFSIEASTLNRQLEVNMLQYGGMRQVAEMIMTSSGEPFLWPTFDDTANVGAILAENTTIGASVDPTFTQVTWNAYKFSSTPILVPYELLQDSFIDLNTVLGTALGERIGRKTNTFYTTGTGSSQPRGIITASTSGVTTASATAITFRELMALVHSVDPAYRTGGGFMCHDNVLLHIRQLLDTQNRPLYVSGLVDGMPDRLLGFPITINQDMASSVATTAKTVLFGKLSNYKIRRVGGPRLYRLEERYRDTDQTGFIAFVREDGNLLKSATAVTKYITQL